MYDLVKALTLPPANLVLVILLGLLLRRRARRTGAVIVVLGAGVLYLLSTSFVASRLLLAVEAGIHAPTRADAHDVSPQAIVILSAGYRYAAADEESVSIDPMTLERLRRGARLHRETGLPVLVTGGQAANDPAPLGTLMADTLREDFGLVPKWIEDRATTTNENALFSARILQKQRIGAVYLVSQAWHLPRAVAAFEAAGLAALPVASSVSRATPFGSNALLPAAKALQASYYAVHEILGRIWYRWTQFGRA